MGVSNRVFLLSFLKSLLVSRRARQTGVLYISLIVSLILGIIVSVINTRLLGPQVFGDFKFIQTIWTLSVIFVTFGVFTTGGNLLAEKKTAEAEKRLMGSLLMLAVVISLVFIFLSIILSFPLGRIYGNDLGEKIRLFSGLVFVFPIQIYLQEAMRGTNDIYGLAWLNVLPQVLYIPAAIIVNNLYGLSLDLALLLYLLTIGVSIIVVTVRSRPRFQKIQEGMSEVLHNNRNLGFHIYVAILMTTATTQLSQFTLAYFYDTSLVGMFALALTITMPLTMIPNAIATTFFKHFASLDRIPKKVIIMASVISVITLVIFIAFIKDVVLLLYTGSFAPVIPIAYICAIAGVLHGIADIFNRYLLAHGKTVALRSNAMHMSFLNIIGYVTLVMVWGIMGAAVTKLIVDMIYLIIMILYYKHAVAVRTR